MYILSNPNMYDPVYKHKNMIKQSRTRWKCISMPSVKHMMTYHIRLQMSYLVYRVVAF